MKKIFSFVIIVLLFLGLNVTISATNVNETIEEVPSEELCKATTTIDSLYVSNITTSGADIAFEYTVGETPLIQQAMVYYEIEDWPNEDAEYMGTFIDITSIEPNTSGKGIMNDLIFYRGEVPNGHTYDFMVILQQENGCSTIENGIASVTTHIITEPIVSNITTTGATISFDYSLGGYEVGGPFVQSTVVETYITVVDTTTFETSIIDVTSNIGTTSGTITIDITDLKPNTKYYLETNIVTSDATSTKNEISSYTFFTTKSSTESQKDTDQDGLYDNDELIYGTDINNPDTDNDNLLDGEEVNTYSTDPLNINTDGDCYNDGEEILNQTDPLVNNGICAEDNVPKENTPPTTNEEVSNQDIGVETLEETGNTELVYVLLLVISVLFGTFYINFKK